MRYGFIGVGNLGAHLAGSLLRDGFDLTVTDLDRRAADSLVAAGAKWAATPRALGAAVDAVISCLPPPAVSERVLAGKDGILEGLAAGGTWIEMSTLDHEAIERLAKLAAARGVATLEAPVT